MTSEAKQHCPVHPAFNEYCPSCISLNRAKAPDKVESGPIAPIDDKPEHAG